MSRVRLAPAKVNLFLHVGPVASDGYHPVASWMMFADVGDVLRLEPAEAWSFGIEGAFADQIGPGENLVEKAVRRLLEASGSSPPSCRLVLYKRLPVAAGLGGGSSDAGAALRLVNETLDQPLGEAALVEIAAEIGADGPACLQATSVLAEGRGEVLKTAPRAPLTPAVLVNPRVLSPTGQVYRAYDEGPAGSAEPPALAAAYGSVAELAEALADLRNDLEPSAIAMQPAIGEVLDCLRLAPQSLFARMSGSGATCFSLCRTVEESLELAAALKAERSDWWVVNCLLQ